MKQVLILMLGGCLLSACMNKPLNVMGLKTIHEGLITQSVTFTHKKQQYLWVCYTEIMAQVVRGISCQNDTALPLFTGGMVAEDFKFEYPSRFLLKIQPPDMLAYIKISLFEELNYNQHEISVVKQSDSTRIKDHKRKRHLVIKIL